MKRTLFFSAVLASVIIIISFIFKTDSFASQTPAGNGMLPWFSVTIYSGTTPLPGASVTITGPSGTSYHTSNSSGQVCTSHGFGLVNVSFTAPRGLSGCADINHQSQTICSGKTYSVYNGWICGN